MSNSAKSVELSCISISATRPHLWYSWFAGLSVKRDWMAVSTRSCLGTMVWWHISVELSLGHLIWGDRKALRTSFSRLSASCFPTSARQRSLPNWVQDCQARHRIIEGKLPREKLAREAFRVQVFQAERALADRLWETGGLKRQRYSELAFAIGAGKKTPGKKRLVVHGAHKPVGLY